MRRTLAALASTALLASAPMTTAAHAADEEPVVAPVVSTASGGATYVAKRDLVRVSVRYSCTNNSQQVHYLIALVSQEGRPNYVRGFRNDTGSLLQATCTGKRVTQTLRMPRSSNGDPAAPGLRSGKATLSVTVAPRSLPQNGGWYVSTGDDVTKQQTIAVRVRR